MITQTIVDIFQVFSRKKNGINAFWIDVNDYTLSLGEDKEIWISKARSDGRTKSYKISSEEKLKGILADLFLKAFTTTELSLCEKIKLLNMIAPIDSGRVN